jgi:hypothetical protein
MSNYQYVADMARIFEEAERRCTINEKDEMARIWAAKKKTMHAVMGRMTLAQAERPRLVYGA